MSKKLRNWLEHADPGQRERLATLARTSHGYLNQLAYGYRIASAEIAGRIEKATEGISKSNKHNLPAIRREDICPACKTCPWAKIARKIEKGE